MCTVVRFYLINVNNEAAKYRRTLKISATHRQFVFKNWYFVLSEDGTLLTNHIGDVPLLLY
jgi:hypothetical protein